MADAFGITNVLMAMGVVIALAYGYALRGWLVQHDSVWSRQSA
jgi:hypothetical protein